MSDDQIVRANFMESLRELAEIAERSNQRAAQGVLLLLVGSMCTHDEVELLNHCAIFASQQIEKLSGGI